MIAISCKRRRRGSLTTAFLVMAMGLQGAAHACSCVAESEDRRVALTERLSRSDLVFLGRIEGTQVVKVLDDAHETQNQRTRFYILESWKGETSSRVTVRTALECCLCEYRFPESGVFLVFARGPDEAGFYETSSCDEPRALEAAKDDIALLDELGEE